MEKFLNYFYLDVLYYSNYRAKVNNVMLKYKNNPLLHSKELQTNTHYEQGFVYV